MAAKTLRVSFLFLLFLCLILSFTGVVDAGDLGGDTGGEVGRNGRDDNDIKGLKISEKSSGGTGAGPSSAPTVAPSVTNGGNTTPKPNLRLFYTLLIMVLASKLKLWRFH